VKLETQRILRGFLSLDKEASDAACLKARKEELTQYSGKKTAIVVDFWLDGVLGFMAKSANNRAQDIQNTPAADVTDLQSEENFTVLNPIDSFFAEIEHEVYFHDTTWSMVVHGVVVGTAWRAEMENFYAILVSRIQNELVKEALRNEIHSYTKYIHDRAEIHAMLDGSNAFFDDADGLYFGAIARITRSWVIAQGYRDKALDLLSRLQRLETGHQFDSNNDDFSYFTFDAEDFLEWMKQEYPALWRDFR